MGIQLKTRIISSGRKAEKERLVLAANYSTFEGKKRLVMAGSDLLSLKKIDFPRNKKKTFIFRGFILK